MAAAYIDEMLEWLQEHGPLGPERAVLRMAADLEIEFESLCLSLNNGLLKNYWNIILPDDKGLES